MDSFMEHKFIWLAVFVVIVVLLRYFMKPNWEGMGQIQEQGQPQPHPSVITLLQQLQSNSTTPGYVFTQLDVALVHDNYNYLISKGFTPSQLAFVVAGHRV